jgi:hypothetical protein
MRRLIWAGTIALASVLTILMLNRVAAAQPVATLSGLANTSLVGTPPTYPLSTPPGPLPPSPPPPLPTPGPDAPHTAVTGIPAIRPMRPGADPGTPTFAADDAITYVAQSTFRGPKLVSTTPVVVTGVEFITSKDAEGRLGTTIGLRDTDLVCVVSVTGTFTVSGPHGQAVKAPSTRGYSVFDARTGNLLVEGVAGGN